MRSLAFGASYYHKERAETDRKWRFEMDAITRRIASSLHFHDAADSLLMHQARRMPLSAYDAPAKRIDSRGHARERERFDFQATFFCYACMIAEGGTAWAYALWKEQQSDIDCIFRRKQLDGKWAYEPVQLKEALPADTNSASMEAFFSDLSAKNYTNPNLQIGIYMNRATSLQPDRLVVPPINVSSLWMYGEGGKFANGGFLCGNLLNAKRNLVCFELPRLPSSLTNLPRSTSAEP